MLKSLVVLALPLCLIACASPSDDAPEMENMSLATAEDSSKRAVFFTVRHDSEDACGNLGTYEYSISGGDSLYRVTDDGELLEGHFEGRDFYEDGRLIDWLAAVRYTGDTLNFTAGTRRSGEELIPTYLVSEEGGWTLIPDEPVAEEELPSSLVVGGWAEGGAYDFCCADIGVPDSLGAFVLPEAGGNPHHGGDLGRRGRDIVSFVARNHIGSGCEVDENAE